ncbi:transcriptional regulator, TetR family [Actinopolyspora alba]|uniref:Transcriptional regulator, TetR family n=1 Tax=Actinopolyspora alba TaxID=673379 RepID=A0A1I1XZ47_9ACTN|nr:TetR family transcriptional regulator [Actinopolyspora alba]SFE12038.1 transcriptional regulator, TetR family [Actinopolyspora alba]
MTEALTAERVLEAAEDTLRRFGPGKTTVVDVARALGVSHGSVYRHFPNKAALRDAVAERWLERVNARLWPLTTADGSATERLRSWLEQLSTTKRLMAREDPELFATYHALATDSRDVIRVHLDTLAGMLARIISDGVSQGEFEVEDPHRAARAVLTATTRFHNPAHAAEWEEPGLDADFEEVWALLLLGLASGRR